MYTRHFDLNLLSDASFREDNGTTGGGRSLTRIPGGNLLGAAAARLAPQQRDGLDTNAFFDAFIAGGVHFSDGLPLHGSEVGLPVPLAAHRPKGRADTYFNLATRGRPAEVQLEQARDGWLTSSGVHFELSHRGGLRTALDTDGRALKRHLHYLDAIPAGTRFRFTIRAEDQALLARVATTLLQGEIRVGRSRTAELGSARIHEVQPAALAPTSPPAGNELVLLCVSDLALRNPSTGSPVLGPTATALGLPAGVGLVPERTFLRHRSYSPFNGHRRRPDPERQVIAAGSVITLSLSPNTDIPALRRLLDAGVGEHRQAGLGQLLVHPDLLSGPEIAWREVAPSPHRTDELEIPEGPLGDYLRARVYEQRDEAQIETWLKDNVDALSKLRVERSQWANLRQIGEQASRMGTTRDELVMQVRRTFGDEAAAITRIVWCTRRGRTTPLDALIEAIQHLPMLHTKPASGAAVARLAARVSKQRQRDAEGGAQ